MGNKRVVIDSNVFISAFIFDGVPKQVVEEVLAEDGICVISEPILIELRRVVGKKFSRYATDFLAYEALIVKYALTVTLGTQLVSICRDPADNMVIETALVGQAKCIVTGDQDLLTLGSYEDIRILTPAQFIEQQRDFR